MELLPRFKLIERLLRNGGVDPFDIADDLDALLERNDGALVFILDELIDGDSDDEFVAEPARVLEQIEMPDMKKIVDAGRITDNHRRFLPKNFRLIV